MAGRQLLVLSVTRLSNGVCVACIDEDDRWIRPTREESSGWRQLAIADLRDQRQQYVVRVGNVVRWPLGPAAPKDVHTEDVLVGAGCPELVRSLGTSELLSRCRQLCDPDFEGFLRDTHRSLTLIEPSSITVVVFSSKGKGGVSARVCFDHRGQQEDLSVTDLAWRALGREHLTNSRTAEARWTQAALQRTTGLTIQYLAVGKGQAWEQGPAHPLAGQYWPFVTTVFTDRAPQVDIDYKNT